VIVRRLQWPLLAGALAAVASGGGCTPGPIGVATLEPDTLAMDLVAHWTFDEGAGYTVTDSSGNGRDGTVTGGGWAWKADGRFGGALAFSGTDVVTVPAFPQATAAFTVSAWLRVSADDLGAAYPLAALLSNENGTGGWGLYLQLATPTVNVLPTYLFSYYTWTGPGPPPGPPPAGYTYADCPCVITGGWVHLAAVVDADAGAATLFVSGAAPVRVPVPVAISSGQPFLMMARSPIPGAPSRNLVGALDDVAIWTRALAAEEIALLESGPAPDVP
jgi:hypothetical protein